MKKKEYMVEAIVKNVSGRDLGNKVIKGIAIIVEILKTKIVTLSIDIKNFVGAQFVVKKDIGYWISIIKTHPKKTLISIQEFQEIDKH